jgi:hypothetical protein
MSRVSFGKEALALEPQRVNGLTTDKLGYFAEHWRKKIFESDAARLQTVKP